MTTDPDRPLNFDVHLYWEMLDDGRLKIALSTPLEKLANFETPGDLMSGFLNVLRWVGGLQISETDSIRTRIDKVNKRALITWVGPSPLRDEALIALQIATAADRTEITVHGG